MQLNYFPVLYNCLHARRHDLARENITAITEDHTAQRVNESLNNLVRNLLTIKLSASKSYK